MKLPLALISAILSVYLSPLTAQETSAPVQARPLHREYRAGEKLVYHMKGVNEAWRYEIDADGIVKKDAARGFYEEYHWSHLTSAGEPVSPPLSAPQFAQRLSLDPEQNPSAPDLSKVDSRIIGPVTDMLTFYADLWLANKLGVLKKSGDHFYFKNPMPPSSWADGSHVLLGEDAIDFDMTLNSVDPIAKIAVLTVKHVPPQVSPLPLKAAWMKTAVDGAGANNWVQIAKSADGKYEAAVGLETFRVEIQISLEDGHIIRATMENPVSTIQRSCEDEALTRCGPATPRNILREIEIALQ